MSARYNINLNSFSCRLHFFKYVCPIHIFGIPHVRFVCYPLPNLTFGLAPSLFPLLNHTATKIILVPSKSLLWKESSGRKKGGNGNNIQRSMLRITKHFFSPWFLWNSNANTISIYNPFRGSRSFVISQS